MRWRPRLPRRRRPAPASMSRSYARSWPSSRGSPATRRPASESCGRRTASSQRWAPLATQPSWRRCWRRDRAVVEPRIQYAKTSDGVDIAFAAAGEGPPLLMVPPPALSHVQAIWETLDHLYQPLAERFRLVWY